MIKEREFYYDELMSSECYCGGGKSPGHSFCLHCYYALPGDMRRDLYRRIGNGYEEGYEAAVKWLEEADRGG